MKTTKFMCVGLLGMTLFTTTLLAQEGKKSLEELITLSTEQLDKKLELSDEQQDQVYKISLKYAQKAQDLKASSASKLEKYRAYQADNKAKEAEMEQVLSKEQFKEWQKISDENRDKMKENRKK